MKLGIYVGSFNPVHKGHIKIVNYVLDKYLDKVVIMPTGAYWDKNNLVNLTDRINMLRIYESKNIIIETEKNELPYTYLVMEYLSEKYKNDELYLIMGADNIVNFDKWEKCEELLKYNLVIINRDGIDIKCYLERLNKKSNFIITSDLDNIDISSTKIRDLIDKQYLAKAKELIDESVLNYIVDKNLYKNS